MQPELIEAEGVRLRPYRDTDVADVAAGWGDPLTQRFIDGLPSPYTEANARRWIGESVPAVWARGGMAYAVADPDSDRLLGAVVVDHPVAVRRQAEIGYWVAAWARGRGVATAAVRAVTGRALATGLLRLELLTSADNVASQRVALAAGYRFEGIRRTVAPRPGGDLVSWVRLADDPPGPTPRLLPDLPPGGLTDGVVALRPVGPDDVDLLHRLHSLPEVVANRVPPHPPVRADLERRCRTAAHRWLAGEEADLIVVDVASGQAGGGMALRYSRPRTGQAMLGASMLPEWRGRGLVTRGLRLLVGWAFDTAGVARLWAGCRPDNMASRRALEKAGFRPEGVQRGTLPGPDGQRVDSLIYGLLPGDRHPDQ